MIHPDKLRPMFLARYGGHPRAFFAPGRVNLIGEHTDYNDGFVLPVALEMGITVLGTRRSDRRIRIFSRDVDDAFEFDMDTVGPARTSGWSDYVAGIARTLEVDGHALCGADLTIASDLPSGAGLSSSAALEVSVGFALLSLADIPVDLITLARAGQKAEHEWVGTQCGIMDPLASACAKERHALFVDCRSLDVRDIPLPKSDLAILVADTRVKHALVSSEYNTRREECEQALDVLRTLLPNARALRDVGADYLDACTRKLPERLFRRARHVITENARTILAARALAQGDVEAVGALFVASHRSLQYDYEVSIAELDTLVDAAVAQEGVLGARMTGGGFGGSVVALVEEDAIERAKSAMRNAYAKQFDREPGFFVTKGGKGACEITS